MAKAWASQGSRNTGPSASHGMLGTALVARAEQRQEEHERGPDDEEQRDPVHRHVVSQAAWHRQHVARREVERRGARNVIVVEHGDDERQACEAEAHRQPRPD